MENFSTENLIELAVGLCAVGIFIARFTKTKKDDALLKRALGVFKKLEKKSG